MANVSFALVLNLHQPAWNLEDLLQHREREAKEILSLFPTLEEYTDLPNTTVVSVLK